MKKLLFLTSLAIAFPSALFAADYDSGQFQVESVTGEVNISGKADFHIVGAEPIEGDAVIRLIDDDSWLYFDCFKPSIVRDNYLSKVRIGDEQAKYPDNVRLAQWGSGCVIIPHGTENDQNAITVYDQINCEGSSMDLEITTYHNNLGDWDNKIKSFKLKRGYMATLANNANGTGHSRCFIADEDDLVFNVLPEGFVTYMGPDGAYDDATAQSFVSYVRVFRWEWVGKKGWGGWNAKEISMANVDSYYGWSASKLKDSPQNGFYAMDHEFVPIKQQRWWPGWDEIGNLQGVSHLLGYNEPDHTDQANVEFPISIDEWPNMFRSGLRLGSPAPAGYASSWLKNFFHYINLCNYRCDFAVAHIYEYIDTQGWIDRVNYMNQYSGGRPVWITEYNNGANWTGETWPDGNRGAGAGNLEHQRQWMEKLMPGLDNIPLLERAHVYNWVEDCRAMVINDQLTPAGEIFSKHISHPGYSKETAYDHIWKIAPPYVHAEADGNHENVHFWFYDHNGETGKGYEVLHLEVGGYVSDGIFYRDRDYEVGGTVNITVPISENIAGTPYYKIQAIGYRDQVSQTTDAIAVKGPALANPSIFKVEASGEHLTIGWQPVEYATSYRIKRGTDKNSLRVLAYECEDTQYTDYTVKPLTVYYYQVGAQSAWSDTSWSGTYRIYSGESGIGDAVHDDLKISSSGGRIAVESGVDCIVDIYMPDGRKCATIDAIAGISVSQTLSPGLYIVNGQKIMVK